MRGYRDYNPLREDCTVDVRDRLNPERLLGRLTRRPTIKLHQPYFSMAACRPFSARAWNPNEPVAYDHHVTTINFHVSYRISDDGWTKHAELLTDTPLGVLMWLEHFVLPGDGERQAAERRWRAGC
jgi:hypothetical protein